MEQNIQKRIKHLLSETGEAFSQSGGNIDYAGFASMALADFKTLLDNPDLTDRQLRLMIRSAEQERRMSDPKGNWSSFLAQHIEKTSNQNKNNQENAWFYGYARLIVRSIHNLAALNNQIGFFMSQSNKM